MKLWLAIVLAVMPLAQQPAKVDISGRWDVKVEAASGKLPNGGSQSRRALSIPLTITLRGAEAEGVFTGKGGETITLKGSWKDGRLDLASNWTEISATTDGQPGKAHARWIVKGSIAGEVLGGTWDFQMGESSLPQRWTARRIK